MRTLALSLLLAAASLSACNGVQSCKTHCDCTDTHAPVKCPGEWACVEGACAYECRSPCTELPYTCGAGESCNGNICSVRPSTCSP